MTNIASTKVAIAAGKTRDRFMAFSDQVIESESGGNPAATNPYSTAAGLGGFTNQTWLDTVRAHRPDLASSSSPQELLAMRSDPALSRQMIDALASDNGDHLRRNGLPVNPATLYLAHFAGANGAASVLNADDSASASSVMSPEAMRANPFLARMTVGDLKSWAARKGGGGSIPASQASAGVQPQQGPDAVTAALSQSGAGGAPVPTSVAPDAQTGAPGSDALSQIPAMLRDSEPQMPEPPPINFNFQTPPGIARARLLARAMMANPLGRSPAA